MTDSNDQEHGRDRGRTPRPDCRTAKHCRPGVRSMSAIIIIPLPEIADRIRRALHKNVVEIGNLLLLEAAR